MFINLSIEDVLISNHFFEEYMSCFFLEISGGFIFCKSVFWDTLRGLISRILLLSIFHEDELDKIREFHLNETTLVNEST